MEPRAKLVAIATEHPKAKHLIVATRISRAIEFATRLIHERPDCFR